MKQLDTVYNYMRKENNDYENAGSGTLAIRRLLRHNFICVDDGAFADSIQITCSLRLKSVPNELLEFMLDTKNDCLCQNLGEWVF